MDNDTVIKVEHLSKKYCKFLKKSMYYGMMDIGRNMFGLASHSERLRKGEPPVIARINKDEFILDMRTIFDEEIPLLARCIEKAFVEIAKSREQSA